MAKDDDAKRENENQPEPDQQPPEVEQSEKDERRVIRIHAFEPRKKAKKPKDGDEAPPPSKGKTVIKKADTESTKD